MIKMENTKVAGFEPAVRGMRNPMNSWNKSDSHRTNRCDYILGANDRELMMKLAKAGVTHAKYRRMIVVWVDITAPLYFWKEFDTYKVGTVANSCSTMHKLTEKEFTLDDFSHDQLCEGAVNTLDHVIDRLNYWRSLYLEKKDKNYWWQMIQLLPSSYNQRRTIMLNYEVLAKMLSERQDHKLDEWKELCSWICSLPFADVMKLYTGEETPKLFECPACGRVEEAFVWQWHRVYDADGKAYNALTCPSCGCEMREKEDC